MTACVKKKKDLVLNHVKFSTADIHYLTTDIASANNRNSTSLLIAFLLLLFKYLYHNSLCAAHGTDRHEDNISILNPDVHSNLEGQKAAGSSKTTRKTKEKTTDKAEKAAKEKPTVATRPESQVRTYA